MIVTIDDATTNLPRLVDAALEGEEVVIARGNESTPGVRLVPVQPVGRRVFGSMKGRIAWDPAFDDPLPDDELALWST